MTVEFKATNKELLEEALKQLGLNYIVYGGRVSVGSIDIYLDRQKVRFNADSTVQTKTVNEIKQQYSMAAIMKAAKKKKWIMKVTGKNKMQAKKW
jgi:hypothetical protein